MIPLSLVTGFLGCGKTTLLQCLIERHRDRRIGFLVNECEDIDVDGRLLDIPPDRLVTIPGGSIFCSCKVSDFLGTLRALADRAQNPATRLDGVVIEASGIADPKVIHEMLRDTRLDRLFDLRTIVAVVDPVRFRKLMRTLPNVIAQVEACQVALVNKIDVCEECEVTAVEAEITRLNPCARVIRCEMARADVDVFASHPRREMSGRLAPCLDPSYVRMIVAFDGHVALDRLVKALRERQPRLYRAKGFVPTKTGTVYVDLSSTGLRVQPAPNARPDGHLVLIAGREDADVVDELVNLCHTFHLDPQDA